MASNLDLLHFRKRRRSIDLPPKMCEELRMVLLGKNRSEISRVGNLILGRDAFDTEALPPSVEQHSERAGGMVEGRYITLINTPHLFDPQISPDGSGHFQLIGGLRDCVSLCSPGPHAFLLILQSDNFTNQDKKLIQFVMKTFSPPSMDYAIVLITEKGHLLPSVAPNKPEKNKDLQQLISECKGRSEKFTFDKAQVIQLLKMIEKMVKDNKGHLTCQINEPLTVRLKEKEHSTFPGRDQPQKAKTDGEGSDGKKKKTHTSKVCEELKVILLGKNSSEISKVGNFILGRDAFDTEALPASVEQHSERAGGMVEGRYITLINTPHLIDTHLTVDQITVQINECMTLCSPGPHVLMLVLQQDDFTEADNNRLNHFLHSLSEDPHKHMLVLTTQTLQSGSSVDSNEEIISQKIIAEYTHTHLVFNSEGSPSALVKLMQKMDTENKGIYLKWDKYVDAQSSQRLNLVLCGSNRLLKSSISDLILGQRELNPESSSACVHRKAEVFGRLVTLVELPALYNSHLSEEEVLKETVRCVTLCDPGVHAFLLILPVDLLTDEDKGEVEKIQMILGSKVKDHLIVVFTTDLPVCGAVTDFIEQNTETNKLITACGNRYTVVETKATNSRQVSELLDIAGTTMETKPFSINMYMKAQEERLQNELMIKHKEELRKIQMDIREREEKYKTELNEKEKEIQELKGKIHSDSEVEDTEDSECLRVVLIGKTGRGKSATGNTILGRDEFEIRSSFDSVTTVCQKGAGEIEGTKVTVVDTPGLFDTTLSKEETTEEIVKCISLSAPGPHAFIIVLSVGRFTNEESETLALIKKIFGPKVANFSIVLFTRGDELGNDSIEQQLEKCKIEQLKKLIRDCGNRFLVFNNNERNDRCQVSELLRQIETMVKSNAGRYFTNEMFQEAEISIKKKMEQILKKREKEIEAEKEKLKAEYSAEMEKMKKKLEDEKLKAEKEKLKMEKKFREKMEALQKEFEETNETEKKKQEMEDKTRLMEEQKQMQKWQQRINELERENKNQKANFEKQLKNREEEDKKREERYKQEREKLNAEQYRALDELKKTQEEELKRRSSEEQRRKQDEEDERSRWERKIKEAEHERKEIQDNVRQRQREWEEEKTQQMKEREEEDRKRKQKHDEELRAKQEEQDRMREKFEKEREVERHKREDEKRQWIEQRERDYDIKKQALEAEMKEQYERLEQTRKEEWNRRKQEDDERREQEKQRLQKLREEIETERQKEIKKRETEEKGRKEREETERDKMEKEFDQKIREMKKKFKDEARGQAEEFNEFKAKKNEYIQEIQNEIEEKNKQYKLLKALHELTKNQKDEEYKKLQAEVEEYLQKQKTEGQASKSTSWCPLL